MNSKSGEMTTDVDSSQSIPEADVQNIQPSESDQQAADAAAQSNSDLTARISQIFADQLIIEVPDLETDLIEVGLLDSLTMVDLLVHLEREFGFTVVMDELEVDDFRSVERIAGYVTRCRE